MSTAMNLHLGGLEWDNAVANWLARQQAETDPSAQEVPINVLLPDAERAKRCLSVEGSTRLVIHHGGLSHVTNLRRDQFEDLTRHLMGQVEQLCEEVLRSTGLSWRHLTGAALLGGSSRLPMIVRYFEHRLGQGRLLRASFEEAVAFGAAMYFRQQQSLLIAGSSPVTATAAEAIDATSAPLRVLDTIAIPHGPEPPQIELCEGDLTNLRAGDAVDVLVVSAFPDEYTPMPRSLIGSLYAKGVSVAELASCKEVDLRQVFSCWMSGEVLNAARGLHFRRVLCFEPYVRGTPADLVGDIFRSLAPFVGGSPPVRTVAMPLVATGYQLVPAEQMLRLIVDAAAHWMAVGLPLTRLKIACLPGPNVDRLRGVFAELKARYGRPPDVAASRYHYDIFLSYAHANGREVAWLVQQLQERKPDLRLFIDRKELNAGSAWQREIFESLDNCARVVAVYSPAYLASKVCLEEFNIALCRHRESPRPILAPLYLYSAELPTYMRVIQFWACREFDHAATLQAVGKLVESIGQ